MNKNVQLFVEGRSDKAFFEGSKFREFAKELGYSIKVKNLKCRGNVVTHFEKHLRLSDKFAHINLLVYDRDRENLEFAPINKILKQYNRAFQFVAIQELEAWFLADHEELLRIKNDAHLHPDTQSIENPKEHLRTIFRKAGKGHKTENGLAEHYAKKINLANARLHNKSLDRFLGAFENNFPNNTSHTH